MIHLICSYWRFGSSLRDSLLFDFGAMLMSKESFWVFGIDYLEQCSAEGNGAIELFLSKMNIKTEKNAMKILNVIKSKGLVEAGEYRFLDGNEVFITYLTNYIYTFYFAICTFSMQKKNFAEFRRERVTTMVVMATLLTGLYAHKTTFTWHQLPTYFCTWARNELDIQLQIH